MRYHLIGLTLLGLLAAAPGAGVAQNVPERSFPPRVIPRFELPDSSSVRRIPLDSLRHLLVPQFSARRTELTCPMPVSRPNSLSTVPIPRARLTPNTTMPIPVERASCRNPLRLGKRER